MRNPLTWGLGLMGVVAAVITLDAGGGQRGAAFEVASLKRNNSWFNRAFQIGGPPGRFTATNVPLRELILFAYKVQPFQLEGGPAWVNSDRFDIVAKLSGVPPPPIPGVPGLVQLALQRLLAERFKLALRHQSKELPIFVLTLARSDGRLGPRLQKSKTDCAALDVERARGGARTAPTETATGRPLCGLLGFQGGLQSGGLPIVYLAANLAPLLQRVVSDRTGLTGNYDFELTWTPEQLPQGRGDAPPGTPPIDPNGPSLFTALQEQLGLKLESTKGAVDVLVVDHVEKPTAD